VDYQTVISVTILKLPVLEYTVGKTLRMPNKFCNSAKISRSS